MQRASNRQKMLALQNPIVSESHYRWTYQVFAGLSFAKGGFSGTARVENGATAGWTCILVEAGRKSSSHEFALSKAAWNVGPPIEYPPTIPSTRSLATVHTYGFVYEFRSSNPAGSLPSTPHAKFRRAYLTPDSSLPFVCARYAGQNRGVNPR